MAGKRRRVHNSLVDDAAAEGVVDTENPHARQIKRTGNQRYTVHTDRSPQKKAKVVVPHRAQVPKWHPNEEIEQWGLDSASDFVVEIDESTVLGKRYNSSVSDGYSATVCSRAHRFNVSAGRPNWRVDAF